ncbi:MAG TPA: Xaa-Pro peptidase family protein [Terriglobales bacterium]|nr:Xaa-Pro peptidase family protein [Terriglobales bacterium]
MHLRSLLAAFVVLAISLCAHAQYTDMKALEALGGPAEFARRREVLANEAKTGFILLMAKVRLPEADHYREDNDFYYFTGLQDPGAVMLMDVAAKRVMIFEPQQTDGNIRTFGRNLLSLPQAERDKLGYPVVQPLTNFDGVLAGAVARNGGQDLWLRLGFGDKPDGARMEIARDYATEYAHPLGDPTPGDRSALQRISQRFPAARLRDLTGFIDQMRNIKTPQEIDVLHKNGKLSAEGLRRAMAIAYPGIYEYEIEAMASYVFRVSGAQGIAYPAIVGASANGNIWHYFFNRTKTVPDDLIVFDYAADLHHMTMDITRTFNVSGKFTPEQAKWYAVDLEAQKAVIEMLRPGNTYAQAAEAGKKVFEKAGIGNQWRGFPGHTVGLATHDVVGTSGPILAGQVVTVEPIIEFNDKKMHFRIEDTILITDKGPEILSAGVPKEMAEVEKLVGSEAKKPKP